MRPSTPQATAPDWRAIYPAAWAMAAMAAAFRKDASSEAELLEALAPRIDRTLFDGPQPAGSLVFHPPKSGAAAALA